MANTLVRVFAHMVWSTWQRTPWVDVAVERTILDAIAAQGERLGCPLHAFGAHDDHVHAVIEHDKATTLVAIARAMKGASARAVNMQHRELGFRWQEGYGAFSVSERDPAAVFEYVRNQRQRHATGRIDAAWEPEAFDGD